MGKNAKYYPLMDLMRYLLALGVIVRHFDELTGHSVPYPITSFYSVGGFFALSGFLVYPIFERTPNLRVYLRQRAIRLLPSYFFIVLLCAFGLSFVSSLSPGEYFGSGGFRNYLLANLSFLNWLHPDLPGVFDSAEFASPAVNGSLWTMKIEWCLYLSIPPVVALINRYSWNKRRTLLTIIIVSIAYRLIFNYLYEIEQKAIYEILSRQFFGQLAYFYTGAYIYQIRDYFRKHLFGFAAVAVILILLIPYVPYGNIIFAPIAVSTVVLALSLIDVTKYVKKNIKRHKHNISYEMYLFHYPIIKLLMLSGVTDQPVWVCLSVLLILTILLGILCHFLISLPISRRLNRKPVAKEKASG